MDGTSWTWSDSWTNLWRSLASEQRRSLASEQHPQLDPQDEHTLAMLGTPSYSSTRPQELGIRPRFMTDV